MAQPSPTARSLADRWVAVLGRGGVWAVLGGTAVLLALALFVVDLTPRVEQDFFFSTDDPQLQASQEIERLFPSRPQILLDARAPDLRSDGTIRRVGELTEALAALDGVAAVRSLTRGPSHPRDAFDSPLWRRLLVAEDGSSTLLLVELADGEGDDAPSDPGAVVSRVEEVLARFEAPDFDLAASGVPWVVEHIRRRLTRDLRVFTFTGLLVFGVVVLLLYRDLWIAIGTLSCCLAACAATLLLLKAVEVPIGVLTANLATLVFVLTLSHCIYLTASHRRHFDRGPGESVAAALALTAEPSFWCMVTTLLGFVSLRFASAKPLQELGTAGAVGTVMAFVLAYLLYPAFLRRRRRLRDREPKEKETRNGVGSRRLGAWATAGLAGVVAICALGLPRLDTDPALPTYFRAGGEIRRGIERIDATGGSSPLNLLFRDQDGARLDDDGVLVRLGRVQQELESDPAVGTALSLPVLVREARRNPMSAFLPLPGLLDLLSTPGFDQVARSFVTGERTRGLALLRMREQGRAAKEDREEVVARLTGHFREQGFEVELAGGLYPLQGALSDLVRSSVVTGLGGLGLLFIGVGLAVSRSSRVTAVMLVCLAGTPVFLFGVMGHLRMPLDLISSPAANVAIAMGIDSMIHLVTAVRRRAGSARASWADWAAARYEMWKPITGSALLLAAGFGIFGLSSFPPTRRFGLAVLLGLGMAAALTLTVLPWGSARRDPG